MIIEFLLGIKDLVRNINGTHKITANSINILEYIAFPTTKGKNVEGVTMRGMNRTQKTKILKHKTPAVTRACSLSVFFCSDRLI